MGFSRRHQRQQHRPRLRHDERQCLNESMRTPHAPSPTAPTMEVSSAATTALYLQASSPATITLATSSAAVTSAATTKTTSTTTIVVDGMTVLLTRKRIKNMYLRIRPVDGAITVSAPLRMQRATIEDFVRAHRAWINRTQQSMGDARRHQQPTQPGNATLSAHELFMLSWPPERQKTAKQYLHARVPQLAHKWTRIIGRAPTSITYRAMTSRWGSCTPATGRIRLNLELALVPEPLMEYVLVHELVHLWEPGHGAGFQRRMDSLMPDWKQRRHDLNTLWRF